MICLLTGGLLLVGCGQPAEKPASPVVPAALKGALGGFSTESLLEHIRVLASDGYEGRAPGTPGEELTIRYLTDKFTAFGLQPGNPDGTYIQKVPLIGSTPQARVSFTAGQRNI
ncbi:MAG: peptidase M28, partial [Acidobacteria bacterium]|nr:peptidase M28 [Acidobacteriota bacterium]